MNKKVLALILAVGFMAGSQAFASRARLLVMGTGDGGNALAPNGNGGSFFVDDAYNMFYNPAFVNDYKDWAVIEKTNSNVAGNTTAQGGFVTSLMNFNLGVFMNRVEATDEFSNGSAMRPIDLTFGGDMGMKWGLGVTYGNAKSTKGTDNLLNVRLGIEHDGFEPFANYNILGNDRSKGTSHKDTGWQLGFRYHFGDWIPYASYQRYAVDSNFRNNSWGAGLGRGTKLAEGIRLNYALSFWRNSAKALGSVGSNTTYNPNRIMVPIDMSVEGDVLSWLVLRGGVAYRIWDRSDGATNPDSTSGRLGAGIKVSKMVLDWAIGSGAPAAAENPNSNTFGFDSGFFTAASLSYNW